MADFFDDALLARLREAQQAHPGIAELLAEAISTLEMLDSRASALDDELRYDDRD